jgi:seryl-tRNA synthetase
MQRSMNATQQRDPRTAAHHQRQAMASLNRSLKEVSSSCSNCNSCCNSATGMNQTCNKAGQMAGQQMQINQGTEALMQQGNPSSMTQGQQAAMQRLADQQEALAKAAEQLANEAASSRQTLGRLDEMGKEMREIAKDLRDRNVTTRTRERQERIVSRLLDFQRSAREREFKPQRQAQTGVDMVRATPPPISPEAGRDELRQDLLRALDSKFVRDYEMLIRQYFDALGKMQTQ